MEDQGVNTRGSRTTKFLPRLSVHCIVFCAGEVIPSEENIKASIEAVVTKARQEAVEGKEESDESQSSSSNSSSSDSDSSGSKYIVSPHISCAVLL